MKRSRLLASLGLAGILLAGCSSSRKDPPASQQIGVPAVTDEGDKVGLGSERRALPAGADKYAAALDAMLSQEQPKNPLPEGARLMGLKIVGTKAVVDLSAEFGNLNRQGNASEALAQKALRAVFAQFPEIETLDVTLEGKVFEGAHSGEWTDISVRDEAGSGD
jgi:hypothetical protein